MKIGFIGLGKMGGPMAQNVLKAGLDLVVHDVRKDAAQALLAAGAQWAESPATVAESCRIVITSLPTPPIVEQVVLGSSGLKEGWQAGDIYVDTTTNSVSTVRHIAEKAATLGVDVLDAPVSGGTLGAVAGTLTIMVGGEPEVLEKVRPVLETMGERIFHLGPVGCGNVAKLVNNMVAFACTSVCAEGMVLGTKAGIDPLVLHDLMVVSTADNWGLCQYPRTVFKRNFTPGFEISLAHQDMSLALGLGKEYGVPLPVAEMVKEDLAGAMAAGLGGHGVDAVILPLEEKAGVTVRPGSGRTRPPRPATYMRRAP
jgi:2-hydroxymethylglutarate dehydrogenase